MSKINLSNKDYKEIINTSYINYDISEIAEISTKKKLQNIETNNFHFYDIPPDIFSKDQQNQIKSVKFNSIHNSTSNLSGISKKNISKNRSSNISFYENNIRKKISKILFLGEIYNKFNIKNEINVNSQNIWNLEAEIKNIDEFDKKKKKGHTKTMSLGCQNKFTFPSLVKNNEFQLKYAPDKKIVFSSAGDLIYKDSNFKQILTNYMRFDPIIFKTNTEDNENNNENINDFEKKINSYLEKDFDEKSATIIEKSNFYARKRADIEKMINNKIKFSENIIYNKEILINFLRKENSLLIEKMSTIKFQLQKIQFLILNNKDSTELTEKYDKNLKLKKPGERMTIFSYSKMPSNSENRTSSMSMSDGRAIIGKYLEKNHENQLKEVERTKLKKEFVEIEKIFLFNKNQIEKTEINVRKEKVFLKEIIDLRNNFYLKILKKGVDCDLNEGLTWILKCLWKLGVEIKFSHLPDFLDNKSRDFIFAKGRIEQNIIDLETLLKILTENYKNNIKNQQNKEKYSNFNFPEISQYDQKDNLSKKKSFNDKIYANAKKIIKDEIIPNSIKNSIKTEKSVLTPTFQENKQNSITFFENEIQVNDSGTKIQFLTEFESIQKKILEKTEELRKLERKEVIRMIKEFDYKQYDRKYKIDCDTVLAALIGSKMANQELIRNGMNKTKT